MPGEGRCNELMTKALEFQPETEGRSAPNHPIKTPFADDEKHTVFASENNIATAGMVVITIWKPHQGFSKCI